MNSNEIDPKDLYHDIEFLAPGGFSQVYKAKTKSNKEIAIKKISLNHYKQIQRELSLLEQCNSRYVIKLLNKHRTEGQFWIVLEYCSGGSIQKMAGNCNENKLRKIIKDALTGLKYIHSKKFIHRDINPHNIFYHQEQNVYKLGDFGCSKNIGLSSAKTNVGTASYKSPEMVLAQNVTIKTDIWSLGITVYFLATNEYPFNTQNYLQLIKAISEGKVSKLADNKDKIFTQGITNFVNGKCLLKNPKHRDSADKLLKHPWIIDEQKDEQKYETEDIQKLESEIRRLKAMLNESEQKYKKEIQNVKDENLKLKKTIENLNRQINEQTTQTQITTNELIEQIKKQHETEIEEMKKQKNDDSEQIHHDHDLSQAIYDNQISAHNENQM